MLKIFLLLPLMLLLSCSYPETKHDCSLFREGKFLLKDSYTRTRFSIERKNGFQTELNENTDTITTLKINWISSCEYELIKIGKMKKTVIDSQEVERAPEYIDEKPIKVTIVATTDKYYIFEIKNTGLYRVYTDTIWKLNR